MDTKPQLRIFIAIVVLIVLSLAIGACSRQASQGPATTPDVTYPVPGEGDQNMGGLDANEIATQTAVAQILATSAAGETAPTPAVVTETPVPAGGETQPPVEGEQPAQPQPTPQPAPQCEQASGIPTSYSLQKGEFPFCIARRFDVNQYELLNINGLTLNSQVPVGYNLKIPQTGNHFAGDATLKAHPASYTVVAGDTFYTVACKYGDVTPELIACTNNKSVSDSLSAGQVLQIP